MVRTPEPRSRSFPWRTLALAVVALLSSVVIVMVVTSIHDAHTIASGPAAPCPPGFVEQLGRGDALRARLRSTAEGSALLDVLGDTEVRFCFGEIEVSSIAEGRALVLDRDMDEAELAARVGHLLDHVVHGSPFPSELDHDADCDRVVHDAMVAEARAYAIEVRLRRALDVPGVRFEFEAEAARARDPEAVVLAYLLAHPDGGPGLDALAAGYYQRCQRERDP